MNWKANRTAPPIILILSLLGTACVATFEEPRQEGVPTSQEIEKKVFEIFELQEVRSRLQEQEGPWLAFLEVPTLTAGLYQIFAGGDDRQGPHHSDEVYYVLEGKAVLKVGEEERPVQKGSIAFVAARQPHRFQSISEDLLVLVFFSKGDVAASAK